MSTEGEQAIASDVQKVSDPARPDFDIDRVDAALAGTMFAGKLHHFTTVESTQSVALAAAQAGAEAGQVYVADEQTAGRGRGGHTWHSAPGTGLYVTVLLRPAVRSDDALSISLAAGLAAQAAIAEVTGLRVDLRWPNDLVTMGPGSRKLGGILTESAMQPDGWLRYAAVGLGMNVNASTMPPELQQQAASLRMLTGERTSREDLLIALLHRLVTGMEEATTKTAAVLARFALGSTWVRGKRVRVTEDGDYTGVTDGLTETGLLRVLGTDGTQHVVRHGGVREWL